jgi:hypothetical protein
MSGARPLIESPADEYDRRLSERRDAAARQVARLLGWWVAVQVVALTELCVALVYRDRFDIDGAVTVGLIWSVSLPVAVGAVVTTARHWAVLPRASIAAGLAAWGVMLVEVTVAGAIWRLVA